MFGPKMRRAEGLPEQWEDALLLQQKLTWDGLAGLKKLAPGSRRALLIWLRDMEVRPADDGVWLNFTLPKGAYATTVLNCFLKTPK